MNAAVDEQSHRLSTRSSVAVGLTALAVRLAVVVWAGVRFPPAADGFYYDTIARRIAQGFGYTWLWPDGAVTFAAHYPVGYPAIVGLLYRLLTPSVVVAAIFNAVLGAAAAVAAADLVAHSDRSPRYAPMAAGLTVALHPALVAYVPAVMTEGATAALLVIAAACVARAQRSSRRLGGVWTASLGIIIGIATLVRPQSLALAPLFGAFAVRPGSSFVERARRGGIVALLAVVCCLPWTARNCYRMNRCALVSVNGGWNLLIGVGPKANGAWSPVDVPPACSKVWEEADKDACFGREAARMIVEDPGPWLSLVPAKLAATFDYCGAAGYYLHVSNAERFNDRAKITLGTVETIYVRLGYLFALAAAAAVRGPRRALRLAVAAAGAILLFQQHAYLSVLLLTGALALAGRALEKAGTLYVTTFIALLATVLTHAVFFGAGRYGMVVFPLVTGLAVVGATQIVETLARYFARPASRGISLSS
jgi:hypothetical protein